MTRSKTVAVKISKYTNSRWIGFSSPTLQTLPTRTDTVEKFMVTPGPLDRRAAGSTPDFINGPWYKCSLFELNLKSRIKPAYMGVA
ncbi:hypothetical protein AVEN_111409-1 [Araneus ventricosus]|uniref:Uncharacterized protein n=1 Tax=Araneus ventricosus TaxID=182803 RepID=A0A4Y2K1N0_ARAVE|nr:hypothetical protein AVEN_111409-1 [Araneus ventricosus]